MKKIYLNISIIQIKYNHMTKLWTISKIINNTVKNSNYNMNLTLHFSIWLIVNINSKGATRKVNIFNKSTKSKKINISIL